MDTLSLEPMRHCPRRTPKSTGGHFRLPRQVWRRVLTCLTCFFYDLSLHGSCPLSPTTVRPAHLITPAISSLILPFCEKGAGAEVDGGDTRAPGRSE